MTTTQAEQVKAAVAAAEGDPAEWGRRALSDGGGKLVGFFLRPEDRGAVLHALTAQRDVLAMVESFVDGFAFVSDPDTTPAEAREVAARCADNARRYADLLCGVDTDAAAAEADALAQST